MQSKTLYVIFAMVCLVSFVMAQNDNPISSIQDKASSAVLGATSTTAGTPQATQTDNNDTNAANVFSVYTPMVMLISCAISFLLS